MTLTLRALRARPLRLAMSAVAVALGVAFLSGVLVFSHGLSATFERIVDGSTPDAVVRAGTDRGFGGLAVPTTSLDPALVRRLAALPQVARADGQVEALGVTLLGSDGTAVGGSGAPTLALSHDTAPNMDGGPALGLRSGTWPVGLHQVVLDEAAAHDGGYRLGDVVRIVTSSRARPVPLRLVGTAELTGGGTAGATLVVLSTPGAQHLLLDGRAAFTRIALTAAPGVSQQQLAGAAAALVPRGYQAVTGDRVAQESENLIGGFLDAITVFLLVFAVIALVVCGFIIVNTFSILVAQRTRELALLRALGASRRQVRRSVLLEAAVVGLVASTIGVLLGWALARLVAAVFTSFGLAITTSTLVLTPRSVLGGYVVGVGVTAAASYLPAARAGRTAPLAALRSEQASPVRPPVVRSITGVLGVLLGAGCAYVGAGDVPGRAGSPALWVGIAGVTWIVSLALLMPVLARPALGACGAAYARVFGISGLLAGENARRAPRRTGATASALMIALALVATVAVLASSLNATIDDSIDRTFRADFRVQSSDRLAFPTAIGDRMTGLPGVAAMSREQDLPARYAGGWVALVGVNDAYQRTHGLVATPSSARLTPGAALVTDGMIGSGVKVGQMLTLSASGRAVKVRVAGSFDSASAIPRVLVPMSTITSAGIPREDNVLMLVVAPGASSSRVRAELEQAAAPAPYVAVYSKQEYAHQLHVRVDQLLFLIYGLLALAILIAVLGVVNTLSLSVFERTRELGLLRAVGMSRAQVRRMVALESVAISLLGAGLGLGLGVLVGALLQHALASDLTALGIPVLGLVAFLAVAVLVGILAAVAPGTRAARMSPLSAAAADSE